jgi:hypothetical protein
VRDIEKVSTQTVYETLVRDSESAGPNRRLRTVAEILVGQAGHNFGLVHSLTGGLAPRVKARSRVSESDVSFTDDLSGSCKTLGPVLGLYRQPTIYGGIVSNCHINFGNFRRITPGTVTMRDIDGLNFGSHSYYALVYFLYFGLLSQIVPLVCLRCSDDFSDVSQHRIVSNASWPCNLHRDCQIERLEN